MSHENYMRRALQLAEHGKGRTKSNPLVGAVIVHNDRIIGEGYHEFYGGPHAEVNAINAVENKALLSESTIYVTLEPCAHHGKTPPCSDLLIQHRLKTVVVGTRDPFIEVNGKGIEKLKSAGIEVIEDVLKDECRELNKRFFHFHMQKRPYIVLKWAQSADGFIDVIRNGNAREINWITEPETQVLTHSWRAEEMAILCGWKTIANDNPSLTTRAVKGENPIRIILDPDLKAPADSTVFTDGEKTLVFNKKHNSTKNSIEYIQLFDFEIESIAKKLYELSITSVIIEGGASTLKRFIESGIYDEIRVLTGTKTLGNGLSAPEFPLINCRFETFGNDQLMICVK